MPALTPVTLVTRKTNASFAVAINRSGQVAATIENEDGVRRAVLYRKQMVELGTLGGSDSYAGGINNAGEVVGTAQNADGHWRAFVVRTGAGMRDLGTLGGRSSHGAAINDAGQVAGFADTADGYFRAFRSDGVHAPVDLGTLGGQDLLSIIAAVLTVAAALVIGRRRYRGTAGMASNLGNACHSPNA